MRTVATLLLALPLLTSQPVAGGTTSAIEKQVAELHPGAQIDVILKDGTKLKGSLDSLSPGRLNLDEEKGIFKATIPRQIPFTDIFSVKHVHRPIRGMVLGVAETPQVIAIGIFCGIPTIFGKGCDL
jgi:hypothetical protein